MNRHLSRQSKTPPHGHNAHLLGTMWLANPVLLLLSYLALSTIPARAAEKPNIVYILADDLGYGDVGCYNAQSKIPTPHLDRLAAQGMRFTDAHAPSSVCTPTRYALLTGRYAWRSPLKRGVLGPWGVPIIAADRLTVPSLLRQHGYATAMIGKWHLGLNYTTKDGQPAAPGDDRMSNVDFTKPIADGPTARGFDYYFGVNVPNYPPFCFIENDRIRKHQHASMGERRGVKRDLWEGGHRVPFLARWPGKVPAAAVSDETICLVDFMATIAALLDVKLPPNAGEDSFNLLPVLRGEKTARPVRAATVHHGFSGRLAIRRGDWVLVETGTGDDNRPAFAEPAWLKAERGYGTDQSPGQLFNLRDDPTQKNNLYDAQPNRVGELQTLLDKHRHEGRSTPGPAQESDPPLTTTPQPRQKNRQGTNGSP